MLANARLILGDCIEQMKELPSGFIGIELEEEYFKIAQARIKKWEGQTRLEG